MTQTVNGLTAGTTYALVHWSGWSRHRPFIIGITPTTPALINKNYAPMLPWIDRLFGSYYLPKDRQPSVHGTDTAVPANLVGQLLDPFAPALYRQP